MRTTSALLASDARRATCDQEKGRLRVCCSDAPNAFTLLDETLWLRWAPITLHRSPLFARKFPKARMASDIMETPDGTFVGARLVSS